MSADLFGLPNLCKLDEMRRDVGLEPGATARLPDDWDGRKRWVCAEPVAYSLLMWKLSEQDEIPVCSLHALAVAVASIDGSPKIRGVRALSQTSTEVDDTPDARPSDDPAPEGATPSPKRPDATRHNRGLA